MTLLAIWLLWLFSRVQLRFKKNNLHERRWSITASFLQRIAMVAKHRNSVLRWHVLISLNCMLGNQSAPRTPPLNSPVRCPIPTICAHLWWAWCRQCTFWRRGRRSTRHSKVCRHATWIVDPQATRRSGCTWSTRGARARSCRSRLLTWWSEMEDQEGWDDVF